ncbi:MAG: dihydroorotase [Myxococcota bacterium]
MLVIRGGRVLDPASGRDEIADVLVEKGRIVRVGVGAAAPYCGGAGEHNPALEIVDATSCWVVPGFVDLHVHLREPGQEYKEDLATGLAAAAAGGFTAVCSMANTSPVIDNRMLVEHLIAKSVELSGPRLYPFGAITQGLEGAQLTEMADMKRGGAVGVSDDGRCVMNAAVMRHAMEYARTFDLLVSQHCEDHTLTDGSQMNEGRVATRLGLRGWPREAEDIIVARDLLLAERTGARYHVAHLSTKGAARLVREAKSRGLQVSAEVTPHHLTLTDQAIVGYNTHCKVNPPLRTEEDRAAVVEALADGTIDCIATDHAPHAPLDKDCEFDAAAVGVAGLETAISVLLSLCTEGHLTPLRLMECLSTNPCRLIPEIEGGSLREGAAADITILRPDICWTVSPEALRSRSHNSPWLGQELQGVVTQTRVAGATVYERKL